MSPFEDAACRCRILARPITIGNNPEALLGGAWIGLGKHMAGWELASAAYLAWKHARHADTAERKIALPLC